MYGMVSFKVFCRLSIIGFVYLFTSCQAYRSLEIEMLQPSKLVLDSGKQVAVFNRNIICRSDSAFFLYNYDDISRDDLVRHFCSGVNNVFLASERLKPVIHLKETQSIYVDDSIKPRPLLIFTVLELAEKFKMDYVISIEYHRYIQNVRKHTYNSEWFVRLYDCKSGLPLDSVVIIGQTANIWDNDSYFSDNVSAMAWDRGVKYGERITPHWNTSVRRVYNKGKVLRMGDLFYQDGNIDQAVKIWSAVQKLSSAQAIRAGLNLAWLYEDAGDFGTAGLILQETKQLAEDKKVMNKEVEYLNEYLKIITQRIEDSQLLEQQTAY